MGWWEGGTRIQPFQGWADFWLVTQGRRSYVTPTLGWMMKRRWRFRRWGEVGVWEAASAEGWWQPGRLPYSLLPCQHPCFASRLSSLP